jgi:hypothetical protein
LKGIKQKKNIFLFEKIVYRVKVLQWILALKRTNGIVYKASVSEGYLDCLMKLCHLLPIEEYFDHIDNKPAYPAEKGVSFQ